MKFLLIFLFSQSSPYLMLSPSARSIALGEANVAETRDIEELFLNPAVLAQVGNFMTGAGYVKWFLDVGYGSATFAWRPKASQNVFGFTFSLLNLGEFEKYNPDGEKIGIFTSQASIITLSFARAISENFFSGFNYKWIVDRIDDDTKTGWVIDAGGTFYIPQSIWQKARFLPISTGISFSNLGPGISEKPPSSLIIGFSWATFALRVRKPTQGEIPPFSWLVLAMKFPFYGEGTEIRTGFEFNVGNILFARIGYIKRLNDQAIVDGNLQSYDINTSHLTFGFGINFRDVRVDFAVRDDYLGTTNHLSVNLAF